MLALVLALSCTTPSSAPEAACQGQTGVRLAVDLASTDCEPEICEAREELVAELARQQRFDEALQVARMSATWSSRWRGARLVAEHALGQGQLDVAIQAVAAAEGTLSGRALPTEVWAPESPRLVRALVQAGRRDEAEAQARSRVQCSERVLGLLALEEDAIDHEALELARTCPSWEAGSVALAAAAIAHYSKVDYDAALYEIRGRSNAPLLAEVLVTQGRIPEGLDLLERAGGSYAWDNPGVFAALDQADRPALLQHAATLPPAEAMRVLGAAARDRHVQGADTQPLVDAAVAAAQQRAADTGQCGSLLSLAEILGPHPAQPQALEAAHHFLAGDEAPFSCGDLVHRLHSSGNTLHLASAMRACAWTDAQASTRLPLSEIPDQAQREHTRSRIIQATAHQGEAELATTLAAECHDPELARPWAALAWGDALVSSEATPELCKLVEAH